MKQTVQTLWRTVQHNVTGWCLLALLPALVQSAHADTITIGKGSGIVWEGMPFSVSNTVTVQSVSTASSLYWGVASFVKTPQSGYGCTIGALTTIGGYLAYQIAPGVGIVPRANITANYTLANNTPETLMGSIGLPETRAETSSLYVITNPLSTGKQWCVPPRMSAVNNFYKANTPINATASGTVVIVADGTQTSQSVDLELWFETITYNSIANKQIIPAGTKLRISTLECTVSTPVQINFGAVAKNLQNGAELASQTNSLITQCTQNSSVGITANINVQFRALTGLYEGTPSRLALSQGGGYITGEINNAVTGSGSCNSTSGVLFNSTPLKIGSITNAQTNQIITNQVTCRLCSGGNSLPTGDVSAAAEMLVTFN